MRPVSFIYQDDMMLDHGIKIHKTKLTQLPGLCTLERPHYPQRGAHGFYFPGYFFSFIAINIIIATTIAQTTMSITRFA